jgi:uncharacterized protein YcgI (DUF1989 family)
VLYDDLAQPLMTLTEDTVGRHDTLAGNCSREINMVRYGATASAAIISSKLWASLAWDRATFRPTSTFL